MLLPIHAPATRTTVPESPSMRYPRCEADTPDGARFCIECGTPPQPPVWGVQAPRAKFCSECGTPAHGADPSAACTPPAPGELHPTHLAEQILTSGAALEGERQRVILLFADLKGSVELLGDREPEESRRLLDPV